MNVLWVAGIAAYVFVEKVTPYGHWLSYVTGVALLALGVGLWISAT
jgi:predicted metal-binding membrane protein